jgi:alpha/beta superfamily hydrolase
MKKIVYIIPGYGHSHYRQSCYSKIEKLFALKDIKTVHVDIDWKEDKIKNFSDYTKQFLKVYKKPRNTKVYILGFSYGAIIALLSASKTKPDALIICSLSPYFEEDFKGLNMSSLKWFKKNFTESIYSFDKIVRGIKNKAYLIVGDKEDKSSLLRTRDARKKIKDSSLTMAKGAKHNINQKEYLSAIKRVIYKI